MNHGEVFPHFVVFFNLFLPLSSRFQCKGLSFPLYRFLPRCFIPFMAVVKDIVFPISFSVGLLLFCKKTVDFGMFILYPVTLLKEFMSSVCVIFTFVESSDTLIYWIILSTKTNTFTSFSTCIPLFPYFLIAADKISSTILNRSKESEDTLVFMILLSMLWVFSVLLFYVGYRLTMYSLCYVLSSSLASP